MLGLKHDVSPIIPCVLYLPYLLRSLKSGLQPFTGTKWATTKFRELNSPNDPISRVSANLGRCILVCRKTTFVFNIPLRYSLQKCMARMGVEPTTFALLARRSNQLS